MRLLAPIKLVFASFVSSRLALASSPPRRKSSEKGKEDLGRGFWAEDSKTSKRCQYVV